MATNLWNGDEENNKAGDRVGNVLGNGVGNVLINEVGKTSKLDMITK